MDEKYHLYQWVQSDGAWKAVGVVRNPIEQKVLDGVSYDKIVYISIDSASMGLVEV